MCPTASRDYVLCSCSSVLQFRPPRTLGGGGDPVWDRQSPCHLGSVSTVTDAPPLLEASPRVYDFGFADSGRTLLASFELKNTSADREIYVTHVLSGCGCLIPQLPSPRIDPQGSQRLTVLFHVPAEPGPTSRGIRVEYLSDPGQPSQWLNLSLFGQVRESVLLTPDRLQFRLSGEEFVAREPQSSTIVLEVHPNVRFAAADLRVVGVRTSSVDLQADLKQENQQWTVTVVFDPSHWEGRPRQDYLYVQLTRADGTPFVRQVPILISLDASEGSP